MIILYEDRCDFSGNDYSVISVICPLSLVAIWWYVLYVALHEVYNFTSGLLLKYIHQISRV